MSSRGGTSHFQYMWEAEKKCAQAKFLTTGQNGALNHCPQEGFTGGVEAWTPTPSPGPKPTAAR